MKGEAARRRRGSKASAFAAATRWARVRSGERQFRVDRKRAGSFHGIRITSTSPRRLAARGSDAVDVNDSAGRTARAASAADEERLVSNRGGKRIGASAREASAEPLVS